jgi:hypothetical protein
MSTRASSVNQQGREALHRRTDQWIVTNPDASFSDEFFNIAVSEPLPQGGAHRHQPDRQRQQRRSVRWS